MARRKNIGVSLFSFQDIITSVTAIIILVLLLLTLELLFRKYGLAASDVVRTQVELAKVESQLNEQVQSLEDSIAKAKSDESSSITPTKSELRRQLSSLESKQRKADQAIKDLPRIMRLPGFVNWKAKYSPHNPIATIYQPKDICDE